MILSERGALNGFSKVFFFARSTALRGQGNEIEKIGFLADETVDRARA
jgi:hypothetical protein